MTERMTLWAFHPAVKRWNPIITGMDPRLAVDEMVLRKDRVRRDKLPTRFALRPDGDGPPPM